MAFDIGVGTRVRIAQNVKDSDRKGQWGVVQGRHAGSYVVKFRDGKTDLFVAHELEYE